MKLRRKLLKDIIVPEKVTRKVAGFCIYTVRVDYSEKFQKKVSLKVLRVASIT